MPKSNRMRNRSRSRSRKGGMWPFDSASTGSSYGSSMSSLWDKLTGKKTDNTYDYGAASMNSSYGAAGMNSGYGAAGMNSGYGAASMNSSYGAAGMNSGYGAAGMNSRYGAAGMNSGYSAANYGAASYGGKRRRMRGGSVTPNMPLTGLASSASPVSNMQTVKAQTWVGGRTRRRRHRHGKSCKHRKH